jgi:hypothetical protein
MKKRIIYPGPLNAPEIILVSGSIYSMDLSEATESFYMGVRSRGYTCSTATPGLVRPFSKVHQSGDPMEFSFDSDVTIIDMGEFLGANRFRQGDLPELPFTRAVFFSPVANPSLAMNERPAWEQERIDDVRNSLENHWGMQVHVAPSRLIRPAGTEQMLLESLNEVIYCQEHKLPLSKELKKARERWYSADGLDQVPALERALW